MTSDLCAQVLPRNKKVKKMVNEIMVPFLMYMAKVQPDIAQQLMVRMIYNLVIGLQHSFVNIKTLIDKTNNVQDIKG